MNSAFDQMVKAEGSAITFPQTKRSTIELNRAGVPFHKIQKQLGMARYTLWQILLLMPTNALQQMENGEYPKALARKVDDELPSI